MRLVKDTLPCCTGKYDCTGCILNIQSLGNANISNGQIKALTLQLPHKRLSNNESLTNRCRKLNLKNKKNFIAKVVGGVGLGYSSTQKRK